MSPESNVESDSPSFMRRARFFGRHILASAVGISVAAGTTYLGYKIGTDVVGPENDSNDVLYYAGVAMPTVVIGAIGTLGGFYSTVAIAGNARLYDNNVQPSQPAEPQEPAA